MGDVWWVGAGAPGVAVLHGFGSVRGNHGDFAERLARTGLNALAIDLRGHGESGGTTDAGMVDDVVAALDWLSDEGAGPLGIRGSSLGGFLALNAAARHDRVRAVVAICPAHQDGLADRRGLAWARDMPLQSAVARRDAIARGFWHATGDELVPWQWSWQLAGLSPHPRHLRIVMGGHHRSLQHDPAVQADSAAFLRRHLADDQGETPRFASGEQRDDHSNDPTKDDHRQAGQDPGALRTHGRQPTLGAA